MPVYFHLHSPQKRKPLMTTLLRGAARARTEAEDDEEGDEQEEASRNDGRFNWTPEDIVPLDVEVPAKDVPEDAETINIVPDEQGKASTQDDEAWKETQHPRDKSGKFSETAGGGASSAQGAAGYAPSKQLTQVFKKHGLQPVAGADKPTFYYAASNLKVVVHAPSGSKGIASHWKAVASDGTVKGSGYGFNQLDSLLKNISGGPVSGSQTPEPAPAPTLTGSGQAPGGFTVEKPKHSGTIMLSSLGAKGYKVDHQDPKSGAMIMAKPNGDLIKIDPVNKNWVVQSSGHMTKEGTGLQDLELLLSGTPPSGTPPWKNSSEKLYPMAQSEQQKAYAEAEQKSKAASAKLSATESTLKSQAPSATSDEKTAISNYTGSAYSTINRTLRQGYGQSENYTKTVKQLDSWLAKSEVKEDMTVYRKVSGEYATVLKSVMFPGAKFIDRGFVSTSIETGHWSGDLHFEIKVPKGSKGAYVGHMSQHPGEREFLLPRDTKFKVVKHDLGAKSIELEVDTE